MLDEQQQLFVGLVVNIVRRIRIVTRYLSNTTYFTKYYENQGIKYKNTILHLYAVGQINNLDFRIFIAKMLISSALGLRNGNVF